jgi:hypothetical protein
MTTYQIQSELENLTIRAVADFMFPQYTLDYTLDTDQNTATGVMKGYY